jgi:hypothetical protein
MKENKDINIKSDKILEKLEKYLKILESNDKGKEFLAREISDVIAELESKADFLNKNFKNTLQDLSKEIEGLKEENYILKKVPEKIKKLLEKFVFDVSDNINKKFNFDKTVENLKSEIDFFDKFRFKKILTTILISCIVSIIGSGIGTYFILNKYPPQTKFEAINPKEINVDGDVNVFDMNGNLSKNYKNKADKTNNKVKKD